MPAMTIEIEGLDKLVAKLNKFPKQIARNFGAAGEESAKDVILPTEGLQNYPPSTAANFPPVPYYKRGTGTQYATRNLENSEIVGKQWAVVRKAFATVIGNPVSYARHLHGEKQAKAMADIGWKQLFKVAKEKIKAIEKVYQAWVSKTIKDLKL